MDRLTADLKDHAMALGFDLVGVASAGASQTAGNLRGWIESGMHGDMAYMEDTAELRLDPRSLLAGCRSVVSVAMSYHTDQPLSRSKAPAGGPRVWISRYAWGRDYHKLMKRKLIRLGRWLEGRLPEVQWRACVDSAPILEREWAARSGLGWIGKNTQLLNRQLGSELFLGELLTDASLEADGRATDHCGRCTACLDACPTAAFVDSLVLDARRCIAYLTVEHRGPIPDDHHRAMGAMVAGCDICQEVCPWTIRAPADIHREFQPAPERFWPTLTDLEDLDEASYRRWRAGSPLTRIPYRQFRRSLAVARRNLGKALRKKD